MVGRLVSFWHGPFLGDILVFGWFSGVYIFKVSWWIALVPPILQNFSSRSKSKLLSSIKLYVSWAIAWVCFKPYASLQRLVKRGSDVYWWLGVGSMIWMGKYIDGINSPHIFIICVYIYISASRSRRGGLIGTCTINLRPVTIRYKCFISWQNSSVCEIRQHMLLCQNSHCCNLEVSDIVASHLSILIHPAVGDWNLPKTYPPCQAWVKLRARSTGA